MIACALQVLELVEGGAATCNKWRGMLAGVFDYICSRDVALGQTMIPHNVLVTTYVTQRSMETMVMETTREPTHHNVDGVVIMPIDNEQEPKRTKS